MSYPDPQYTGEGGEASATVRPASALPELDGRTSMTSYLSTGASTGGKYGLYRWDFKGPRSGPDPHFHRSISEAFFVLSGEIQLYDGRRWVYRPARRLPICAGGRPARLPQRSGEQASMLILFAPGAPREDYFERVATTAQMSEEERTEFYLRHDTFWV